MVLHCPGLGTVAARLLVRPYPESASRIAWAAAIKLALPFGGVAEDGIGALHGKSGGSPFVGEAGVWVKALDSLSHRQLAAYVERRAATKIDLDLSKGVGNAVSKGVGGFAGSFDYTKRARNAWAALIGDWLHKARTSTGRWRVVWRDRTQRWTQPPTSFRAEATRQHRAEAEPAPTRRQRDRYVCCQSCHAQLRRRYGPQQCAISKLPVYRGLDVPRVWFWQHWRRSRPCCFAICLC